MPRGSSKPCPGCGEVRAGRPAKEVCVQCKRDLAEVKRLRQYLEAEENLEVYRMGEAIHWNPRFYSHYGDESDDYDFSRYCSGSSARDRLDDAFWNLVRLIVKKDPRWDVGRYSRDVPYVVEPRRQAQYSGPILVRLTPETRDAIEELFYAIHAALTVVHADGKQVGRKWLQGMLDGTYDQADLGL